MRLHFYAGVFVGPFILIAAFTGALYSISPTIESVVNRDLLHVDSTGPARPLADQVAAAVAVEPKLVPAAVDPAPHPGDTTRVLFTDPLLGESEQRAVFVDPATAKSVGVSVVYGSTGALPTRTWIDQLHRNLHLGQPGRLYSETAASWLWVVALAGLAVWLRRAGSRSRNLRRLVWPDRGPKGRPRTVNWHGAVGLWVLAPLLFLSATGMTWSTYAGAHVDALRAQLNWTTPSVSSALPGAGTRPDGSPTMPGMDMPGMDMPPDMPGGPRPLSTDRIAQVDKVFAVARGHHVDGPVEITLPTTDHTAFVVKERRISGVLTQDAIAVDGVTGDVTDTVRYADWPLMAELANWGIALHMGMMFGLANQLLLLLTMIALITVIVRGYLMWWRRRPLHASRFALGAPPRRGVLRGIHPALLGGLAVIAVAVGWFAPMLGLTLLGFLLIDIAIGLVQRRRAAT
ncbi:PepSY-associated TM helix domain-containing protein [Nocardia vaccinii]|uniref:PepSY-associated TM helix domain-containing protein n=1 Tax=Nocardia vaccinii TaxID=1822 RepID=UPI00082AC865